MKIPLARLTRKAAKRKRIRVTPFDVRRMDEAALFRIYMRVIAHWREAHDRIVAAYERELPRTGDSVSLANDSVDTLNDIIEREGDWFTRLMIEFVLSTSVWAVGIEAWQRGKWRGAVLSATGVNIDTMLYAGDVTQTVEATIKSNVALITSVNDQQKTRVAESVFRGLNQRKPAREVAKELRDIADLGRKRSILIASDQLQKIAVALDAERQDQAGFTQFEWRHSGKLHPRAWHQARNGKIYDSRTRREVGGTEVIPLDDMPGIPIRCGCRRAAVFSLDEYTGEDE